MSTEQSEMPRLMPRELKAWDRKVVRALCTLVNTYGIEYRIDKNQMHIFLSAPGLDAKDAVSKFKGSRSRDAEQTLYYLEKWAVRYVRPAVVEESAKALAERFNDPTKKPHEKAEKQKENPVPTEPAEVQEIASSPASDGAPEGYHQHFTTKNGERWATNWWEKDGGGHWLCKDGDYETDNLQHSAAHQRMHSQSAEERKAISSLAAQSADSELQARRTRARNAIKFLAGEYDIPIGAPTNTRQVERLTAENEKLKSQLAAAKVQIEEAKAKVALAKELFGS